MEIWSKIRSGTRTGNSTLRIHAPGSGGWVIRWWPAWEPGFELGSAQARLQACLDGLVVHDSLAAFLERPEDRTVHAVGEYFVYNHGDKLDWNHPNRKGHVRLAEFLDERLVWLGGS